MPPVTLHTRSTCDSCPPRRDAGVHSEEAGGWEGLVFSPGTKTDLRDLEEIVRDREVPPLEGGLPWTADRTFGILLS